jgi:phytoene synthase
MPRRTPASDAPRSDADLCASIARAHGRTFSLAAGLLPDDKRRGAFALYAFCRVADDIVDDAGGVGPDPAVRLADHRRSLHEALAGRTSEPVLREVAWAVDRFGVPPSALNELLDGVTRDTEQVHLAGWAELRAYCEGVAGSVGEMCTHVFGVPGGRHVRTTAVRRGRALGVAMQLTNILRDIGEDARAGRCYLADDELAEAGFTRADVLELHDLARDARWPAFMRSQIARARQLYANAHQGIPLLAPDARACATACARGYALILDAIERQAYDTIGVRAVVPSWRKAQLLMSVMRARPA